MIRALPKQVIFEYLDLGEMTQAPSGFWQLSEQDRREFLRKQPMKVIDAANPPPDIVRRARVIASGARDIAPGDIIRVNGHDADEFELEPMKPLYRVRGEHVLAKELSPQSP